MKKYGRYSECPRLLAEDDPTKFMATLERCQKTDFDYEEAIDALSTLVERGCL